MKVHLLAIGRMKRGPEKELVERYLDRFAKAGAPLGLDFRGALDFPESQAQSISERQRDEAAILQSRSPAGSVLLVLDEKGRSVSSRAFADLIASERDAGATDLAFLLGGPDGHAADLLARAKHRISLGAITLPHQVARLVLSEQLYRAATILAGHPYHRD